MTRTDLGIIAACLALAAGVAIPRHDRLADDERREAVLALARNASSALALAHAQWEQGGRPLTLNGRQGLVAMVNGYPSPATLPLLLSRAELQGFEYEDGRWRPVGGNADCGVSYRPAGEPDGAPAIVTHLDDC